jgi:hypothetical protein
MIFKTFDEIEAEGQDDEPEISIFPEPPKEDLIPKEHFGYDLKRFTPISARIALAAAARDYIEGWFSYLFEPRGGFKTWRLSDTTKAQNFHNGHPCAKMKPGNIYQYMSLTNNKRTGSFKVVAIDRERGIIKTEEEINEPSITLNEYAGDIEKSKRDWVLEQLVGRYNYKDQLVSTFFNQTQLGGGSPNYNSKFSYHQGVVGGGKTTMLVQQLKTRIEGEGLGRGTLFVVSSETNKSLINVATMLIEKGISCIQFTNEETEMSWHKIMKDIECYKTYMLAKTFKPQNAEELSMQIDKKRKAKRQIMEFFSRRVILVTPSKLADLYRMFKPEEEVNFYIDEAGLMKVKNFFPFLLFKLKRLFLFGDHKQFSPHDDDDKIKDLMYFRPYQMIAEKLSVSVADWFTEMNIPHKIYHRCWRLPKQHAVPLVSFHYKDSSEGLMAKMEEETTIEYNEMTVRADRVWVPQELTQYPHMHHDAKEKESARMSKFLEKLVVLITRGLSNYREWRKKYEKKVPDPPPLRIKKETERVPDPSPLKTQKDPIVLKVTKDFKIQKLLHKTNLKIPESSDEYFDQQLNNGLFLAKDYEVVKNVRVITPYTYAVGSLATLYEKFYKERLFKNKVVLSFETARKTQSEGHDYVIVYWPKKITDFIDDRMLLVSYSRHRKWMVHTTLNFASHIQSPMLSWMVRSGLISLQPRRLIKMKDKKTKRTAFLDRDKNEWTGDSALAEANNFKLELKGYPEHMKLVVTNKEKLREFFFNGIYDRLLDYNRMVALPVARMQDVVFVNHGRTNTVSDMIVLEDALNEGTFPTLSRIEPKFKYGFYLLAEMSKPPKLKVRIRDKRPRNELFLTTEGEFLYYKKGSSNRLYFEDEKENMKIIKKKK